MTIKKRHVFFLAMLFLTSLSLQAQEKCGTMRKHEQLLNTDPKYKVAYMQAEALAKKEEQILKGARSQGTVYKIPVVVHVLHLGEAVGVGSNITTDQVYSAITSLNDAYRKKAGTIYDGNGVDVEVEFCLAQKDPNGNATSGINRVNAGAVNSSYATDGITDANEIAVKAISKWDNTKYYNMWVVSEIDNNGAGSGVQGYAYLASGAPANVDGMVVLYNSFGYDPEGNRAYNLKSYTNKNITTIHEMGHALGLYHTFEGDNSGSSCPPNANCNTDGDQVCDTPPHIRSSSNCVTGTNSCDNNSSRELFIHNYMDYSSDDCQTEFTSGQSVRARSQLSALRSNLISAGNLTACGCSSNTAPIPRFYADETTPCEGSVVNFIDESINAPATYAWSFQGGTPATSTIQNPSVTFSGTGPYTVSLIVTSASAQNNTNSKTGYISPVATAFAPLPLAESFEGTFPPTGWAIESSDASSIWGVGGSKQWDQRTVIGSSAGVLAAAINLYDYSSKSQKDDLVLPTIDLTGSNASTLTFKVAFRYYSANSADTLLVLGSTNCGTTYTELYRKGGADLSTGLVYTNEFSPASTTDWRTETVDVTSFAGKNVQLRFRTINEYGNNLYIDDVNITAVEGPILGIQSSEALNIKVYPNPTKGLVNIDLQDQKEVLVEVVNTVSSQVLSSQKGSSNITVDLSSQPQGMYLIIIKTDKGNMVSRVAKTN